MKGAIASVEIFVFAKGAKGEQESAASKPRRLTLTITAPLREDDGSWSSRVALADLHRPEVVSADDSVSALARSVALAESWLSGLRGEGASLYRDREGEAPFTLWIAGS